MRHFNVKLLPILISIGLLSGCANIKPWEHDLLAQKAMQPNAYPVESAADDHTYFSKEAASGGRGFGGGGCGCN